MAFRLEITQVGKFPTSWSLMKLQDFGTHVYLLMRGLTLPLARTKTDGPISKDLREKVEFLSTLSSLSLSRTHCLSSPKMALFSLFDYSFFLSLFYFLFYFKFGCMAHIAQCVHHSFGSVSAPKQFISFQFNLF